jgi:hypothetical protein
MHVASSDAAPASLPLLLTVKMACRLSGLSKSELYRRLNSGDLTGRKVGRSTYIESQDLLRMIRELPRFGG